MGATVGRITGILQELYSNGLLWPIAIIGLLVVLFLIWLLSRRIRLWYWKVDKRLDALGVIDRKLQELEDKMREEPADIDTIMAPETEAVIENKCETKHPAPGSAVYSMGRSGKVYTEQELEELIRD